MTRDGLKSLDKLGLEYIHLSVPKAGELTDDKLEALHNFKEITTLKLGQPNTTETNITAEHITKSVLYTLIQTIV